MKNSYLYLFLLCLFYSCSEEPKLSHREEMGLKGFVKKIVSIDYKAVDKFGQGDIVTSGPKTFGTYVEEYDSLGNILYREDLYLNNSYLSSESICDENGNDLKWISYDKNGEISFQNLYDDNGLMIKWDSYDNGRLKHSQKYEYNEKGDKIKEIDLLDGDVENIIIRYDNNGRKVYTKNDLYSVKYEYEDDLLKKETKTWKIGYVYKSVDVTNYEYDENRQLIKELSYDDGKLEKKIKYEYDIRGNRIKACKEEEGSVECTFYKYDERNRCLDVLITDGENPEKSVIKQRRKYYYANELTNEPYRKQSWNDKGELEYDNFDVCFLVSGDTLSSVSFNKDHEVTSIKRLSSKGKNLHRFYYRVESECDLIRYNYINDLLISKLDSKGRMTTFVFATSYYSIFCV